MTLEEYFDKCPKFPQDLPIAEIPSTSLKKLQTHDCYEAEKLYDACRYHGFFMLDLRGSDLGHHLLSDAGTMFGLTEKTLSLDKAELEKFAFKTSRDIIGYKPAGRIPTENGKFDTTELYTIGQDDILGNEERRQNPYPVEEHRAQCHDFFEHAYAAVAIILNALDTQLGLPKGTLCNRTALNRPSATSSRLLLARAQDSPVPTKEVTLNAHTDIGLITLLFNVAGGLQILPSASENADENWRYIRPEQGHAIVNLGDTLVEWTGGLLRSALHRVVTTPGDQISVDRVSVAYLVRPARGETMQRLRGGADEGEEEDTRTVDEWAFDRVSQIMRGELRPRTIGGISIGGQ